MDYSLADESVVAADLAAQVFGPFSAAGAGEGGGSVAPEQDGFDAHLWKQVVATGLLGLAVGDDVGGSGAGLEAVGAVLEQAGRVALPTPLWPTMAALMVVDRWGSADLRRTVLPGALAGEAVPVLRPAGPSGPLRAASVPGGWSVSGTLDLVPLGARASWVVVPVDEPGGTVAFAVVDPTADGVEVAGQVATGGILHHRLRLDGVVVAEERVVGAPPGACAGAWAAQRMLVMTCAVQAGLLAGALDMTTAYTTRREQFGGPLASLQAVQHRLADCWIDTEAVRWTMWEAVSTLAARDLAELEVEVATYWSSHAAPRVMSALTHLHGGTGVDTSYPIHHYFLASRHLALAGGGAGAHLARLGAMLADGGDTP